MVVVGRVGCRIGACGPVLSLSSGSAVNGWMITHPAFRTEVPLTNRTRVRALAFVKLLANPTQTILPIGSSSIKGLLVVIALLAPTIGILILIGPVVVGSAVAFAIRSGPGA